MELLKGTLSARFKVIYGLVFLMIISTTAWLSYLSSKGSLEEQLKNSNIALLNLVQQKIEMILREIDTNTINFIQEPEVAFFLNGRYTNDDLRFNHFNVLNTKFKVLMNANSMIVKAAQLGIVNGYPDGSFNPDEPMTRLQFAALLVRALKVPTGTEKIRFTDQADIPDWALSELASAVQAGIIQGYEDDTLRPNKEISRAEMITMLVRALKFDNKANTASPAFDDASAIPDWAKASISYAVSAGLVQGKEGNRFVPNDIATRAEAVTVIMRMLEHNK